MHLYESSSRRLPNDAYRITLGKEKWTMVAFSLLSLYFDELDEFGVLGNLGRIYVVHAAHAVNPSAFSINHPYPKIEDGCGERGEHYYPEEQHQISYLRKVKGDNHRFFYVTFSWMPFRITFSLSLLGQGQGKGP